MSLTTTPTNALTVAQVSSLALPAGAEIPAFDAASKKLFVTSSTGLQVVDMTNPAAPAFTTLLNLANPPSFTSSDVSSVAVKNGIVAAALINTNKLLPGEVVFINAATNAIIGRVTVGANPDQLTFTPDGTRVLVANEGEVQTNNIDTADGSVSIINIPGGTIAGVASATVQTATFTAFNGQEVALRGQGVRIFEGKTVAQDVEPEYIAVNGAGTKAMVTLQENNAVALLDIATATITAIVPLGTKDFSTLLADFSDRDGTGGTTRTNLETGNPVFGLYMPDAIASYEVGGNTYYVIANEGDDRDDFINPDESIRAGAAGYDLDNATFPTETALKAQGELGRLIVSNAPGLRGDTNGDGDVDQILTYGARSFSILDANGKIIFDSADIIERIVATGQSGLVFDDLRSDNKGPEPEGVTILNHGGRTYAFVGLERSHGTVVFDVTNPAAVTYTTAAVRPGDLNPEGLITIAAADSPTGKPLLVVANEVTNTLTTFEVTPVIDYTLQLLHFSDGEAGLLASSTAPNLAALVDAFEDDYSNTIVLAGGDNWLPGPFLAAGTDASVRPILNAVSGSTITGNLPIGAVDIAIHNEIGVEASTIGNHEFDLGSNVFRGTFTPGSGWVGANFPYLSSNLDFSGDADLNPRFRANGVDGNPGTPIGAASANRGFIVPAAVLTEGSERIGIVGATTQLIEAISSPSGTEVRGFPTGPGANGEVDNMVLLASQLQPIINEMIASGIDKIILMSHLQQIANEQALAQLLTGVDIILAAGSNTRLGDANDVAVAFPGHAANFANTYPIVTAGADGKPTLIVNTDNEYTYLGRLVVDFDVNGNIITANLPAASTINGAYAATTANVAAAWAADGGLAAAFAEGTKGEEVQDLTDAVGAVIAAKDGNVSGFTTVYLQGERIAVRNQETNLGNLTADANLGALETALGAGADDAFVVSLKNGGGIRAQIGTVSTPKPDGTVDFLPPPANPAAGKAEGGVSQLDIENSLRFNNGLIAFDTTAAGLKAILEHGVALLGNQGRFPQIGGVAFSYDPDLPAGSRITSIAIIDDNGEAIAKIVENGVISPSAPAKITVVTLNFLANGGDGYPIKANGENFRFLLDNGTFSAPVDEALNFTATGVVPANILGEQKALFDFMKAEHGTPATAFTEADTAITADTRIQNLNFRTDTVFLPDATVVGTEANETLAAASADDSISGLGGNDSITAAAGDDTVNAGAGNDTVSLSFGNDVYMAGGGGRRGDGNDSVDGGMGIDTYDASMVGGARNVASINLAAGTASTPLFGNDMILNFENVIGTSGNDAITGDGKANSLIGGLGNDSIVGGGGSDTIVGGAGSDLTTGGTGADLFVFAEVITGRKASETITDYSFADGDRIDLQALLPTFTGTAAQAVAGGVLSFALARGGVGLNVIVDGPTLDGTVVTLRGLDLSVVSNAAFIDSFLV